MFIDINVSLRKMENDISLKIESIAVFNEFKLILKEISVHLKDMLDFVEKIVSKMINSKAQTVPLGKIPKSGNIQNYIQQPTVLGFDDIAGLKYLKRVLFTLIVLPKEQPQLFADRIIGNSILLYGPPGTGKTKLVHGIAVESKAVLYSISLSDILSSLVGETEKNIHEIFTSMKSSKTNSILFMDEIDSLCRKRDSSEHEYTRRIKTEIMNQMSNIENSSNLIVIAATNCPWDLDTAILRRFRKQLYVPLPNGEERMELLNLFTRNLNIFSSSEDWMKLVEMCEGLSGSDISNLVHDALNVPLNELHDSKIWKKCQDGFYEPYQSDPFDSEIYPSDIENICISQLKDLPSMSVRARSVTMMDFFEATEQVQITVSSEDVRKYEEFQNNYSY